MVGYLLQATVLIIIIFFISTNGKGKKRFLIILAVLSCILSILNILFDLLKIYLFNKGISVFEEAGYILFSNIENILNISIICLILTIILIVIFSKEKHVNKFFLEVLNNKVNIVYGILVILTTIGFVFYIPNLKFRDVTFDTETENISEVNIITISEVKDEKIEKTQAILENIETDFSSNDIINWTNILKSSIYVKLNFLDENVNVYTSYDSRIIKDKYIDQIANFSQQKGFKNAIYSNGPELGEYVIIELVYYKVNERQITRFKSIIIYGSTNRDYSLDNTQFNEKAIYIYTLEESTKANLFWINIPIESDSYYYAYEFLSE